ncbi:MAG TPA: GIY-YIG nuclease family protein [Candidatus Omnitrophota bacterium]|nr:GIY-YIG nuclease family protein [Candidatus Omnitrophota bacterium]HQL41498.1 GIY-YIG nuclease family protein [Candidatus Omnitrophota bacterium]
MWGLAPLETRERYALCYVLESKKDGFWYTGCTHHLRKRFSEHNEEKVVSTKGQGPFELTY